jgi:hypothetical protein
MLTEVFYSIGTLYEGTDLVATNKDKEEIQNNKTL